MQVFSGSEPDVGVFTVNVCGDTEQAYGIIQLFSGDHIEFDCSVVYGLSAVYGILREHGFTISGYQTAKIIPFKRPEAA